MTEKELKRLSRAELLELLLIQTRETERLQVQLESAQKKLRDKQIQISRAGDLAQAVLAVNGVVEAAQAAASQYLENIARMEAETRVQCWELLELARADAERIRSGAAAEYGDPELLHEEPEMEAEQLLEEIHQLLGDE